MLVYDIDISGDYALISSRASEVTRAGYVFVQSGGSWTQQAKLTASDAAAEDDFGKGVSISGDYALISAPYNDDNGTQSGSAYVFVRSGDSWTQQAKLAAADAATYVYFGYGVSTSGDHALIGAPNNDDGGLYSGSAYVFAWSGDSWTQQVKLAASDAVEWDQFGISVSISGDYALIGASNPDLGTQSGSAYVFVRLG